jgi:hypothetical protein
MSYRALAWAVEQDVSSTHAFAVLCALAGYAGDTGECWPSQAALSAKTKQTDRSVRNQIGALVESGHIEKAIVQGRPGFRLLMERNSVPANRNHMPPQGNGVPDAEAASRNHIPQNQSLNQSGIKSLPPCPPRGTGTSKFLPGCLPISGKFTATIAAGSSPPPRSASPSTSSIAGDRRATTQPRSSAVRS